MPDQAVSGSSGAPAQQTRPASSGEGSDGSLLVDGLQSRDHAALFSAIDRLRQGHIDRVWIPQIVVCGNQSSGKSSVLEAIAGVAFPTGDSTTTRFATELILRRNHEERGRARIVASRERDDDMKRRIETFQRPLQSSTNVDFARIIREAKSHLEQVEPNAQFWQDLLQIEIIGPSQPHLTLVDLPGIIQYEREARNNAQRILDLLHKYLENPRTIVLAVIDGYNDYQNQQILDITTTTARERTLGVITKTDYLRSGSDHLRNVIRLAKNESVPLSLGWHVLRNLAHEDEDRSPTRRDEIEHQFFAGPDWAQLPRRDVGITALRTKLQGQLFRSITRQLPGANGLIAEMRQQHRQCQLVIDRLGPSRGNLLEQRSYLSNVLNRLSRLIEDALSGDYERNEFESFFDGTIERTLRDRINIETTKFASKMRKRGKQYHLWVEESHRAHRPAKPGLDDLSEDEEPNFSAPFTTASSNTADGSMRRHNVHLQTYCNALASHMRRTRGTSLPGMPSTKTIRVIFRQLSVPWTGFVEAFADSCYNAVYTFLTLAVQHVAGEYAGGAILRAYVYPRPHGFECRKVSLDMKIEELLWPYKECHPMTYHPSFNPQSILESYPEANRPEETWGQIARGNQLGQESIDAADAIDQTESYYNVALNTFVENVASLGIEQCLLKNLASLIPPSEAISLDDSRITDIAAEPPEIVQERANAQDQQATLEDVIRICNSYVARDPEPTQRTERVQDEDDTDGSDYGPEDADEPEGNEAEDHVVER